MLKYGGLSQVGLMAALLKSVGRLKRRGGSSPSSSAINICILQVSYVDNPCGESDYCKDTDCKGNICYAVSDECNNQRAYCRSLLCTNRKDNLCTLMVRIRYRIYLLRNLS